jgi:hypothetical protein
VVTKNLDEYMKQESIRKFYYKNLHDDIHRDVVLYWKGNSIIWCLREIA